nr:Lrp/AsnC ligand binding domain-containing protein [Parachitinimonas caeni]
MLSLKGLDRIDRKILRELQADGRLSNLELAKRVDLSATACLERVKRLSRDGYIVGYSARLNPELLDAGLLVYIQVVLDRTTPEVFDTFKSAVADRPEVLECHMVAGGFDYLIKARVRDMKAYRDLLGSALLTLPGVRETHTYAVMEEVKESAAIHIPL